MLFQKNSSDQLADFDSFNIYRSVMNKSSISDVTCDCGRLDKINFVKSVSLATGELIFLAGISSGRPIVTSETNG